MSREISRRFIQITGDYIRLIYIFVKLAKKWQEIVWVAQFFFV